MAMTGSVLFRNKFANNKKESGTETVIRQNSISSSHLRTVEAVKADEISAV